MITGVATIAGCMFAGFFAGDIIGQVIGVGSNVGGVGFALINLSRKGNLPKIFQMEYNFGSPCIFRL